MKPRFLGLEDVLEIHETRIRLYGGSEGVRDMGLLRSALAQPTAGLGDEFFHKDLFEMAAAYLYHIARNHPFVDGNKRTGLACCLVFLSLNGIELDADDLELEEITLSASQGQIEKGDIAVFLRDNVFP